MRDALRTCLQIAGGLTEATRRRTVGAARELLDQSGIDVDAVQRRIGSAIPPEVQTLADELMASGRANRDLLLGIIREEVDKAMGRVGRLADEVTKVGVVLETLERRIRNLETPTSPPPPPSEPAPRPSTEPPLHHVKVDPPPAPPARPGEEGAPAGRPPAKKAPAGRPAAKKAPAARPAAGGDAAEAAAPQAVVGASVGGRPAAKKAPAKKAPAKKAPAKKAAAK